MNFYQVMRVMKLTMLLITCLLTHLSASTYGQRITLNMQKSNIHRVLEEIRKQTSYDFSYDPELFNGAKTVDINVKSATIEQVLNNCFAGQPYTYEIRNGFVVINKGSTSRTSAKAIPQQPGRISGKVLDERGEPLPGASVKIIQANQSTQSSVDGSYNFTIAPGTYTLEVSYISFQTKRITEVEVKAGQLTSMSIVLKAAANELNQVVVTGSFKKESTAGLYARQKNEAGVSNGISREQIAALPDKNIGETLKRISGVSTTDNRRVVVRGIAERYNLAMMDGARLPSTDVQVRDFEFDIIPSNLVDNVVVSKTATPDMGFGFGGGLVQVNTFAIPDANFTTINFGGKYTNGSTGKDFLGYGRGKNDYLGFDDGGRDHFPDDLFFFNQTNYNPRNPYNHTVPEGVVKITPEMIAEQNKKIGGTERLGTRVYQAKPAQNYQFSLGRSYNLKNSRIGFVGSLSYRNEQNIDDISQYSRGRWKPLDGNPGIFYNAKTGEQLMHSTAAQYNFNTSWGGLLNAGWSGKNHKITSRNFYSRVFSNQFFRLEGFSDDHQYGKDPEIREYDRPKFIDLLQNRVNGEHTFGSFGLDWSLARNRVTNLEQDAVDASLYPVTGINNTAAYYYSPGLTTNTWSYGVNREQYKYTETNRMTDISLKYNFAVKNHKQQIKAGYNFMDTQGNYKWNVLPIGVADTWSHNLNTVPIQQWTSALDFKDPLKDPYYYPMAFNGNRYEGKNTNRAFYAMMDNRYNNWIRLVWGLRAEYYKYEKLEDGASDYYSEIDLKNRDKTRYVDPETGRIVHKTIDAQAEDKEWMYQPSANLTITPFKDFNLRASYGKSSIRPSLIENSTFARYNYVYGRTQRNTGLISTHIDHYDLRMEWYPKAGEVISVGYFQKHFKNPVELYLRIFDSSAAIDLFTENSDYADVKGWEFDIRKSFGFIYPEWKLLDNLYFSGNLTIQNSEVQASAYRYETLGYGGNLDNQERGYVLREKTFLKEKRPLYGQVPILANIGLQYAGERLGANIAFNHSGYKTLTVGMLPEMSESERPRNQLDAQLSYKFLKNKKLETKLNISNLLNAPFRFYSNHANTYKRKPNTEGKELTEWAELFEWKYGFSEKYEEGYYETSADGKTKTRIGDVETYNRKTGTAFSLSVSYSF
ncbi:carboxypeptidase regulatory-like domain-containing protein [Sphingobacterium lactis]|uniref:TonB-dependent receptor n=1 Tax=Sphingobacterium lactis TaxID=797291 RepID=UPI003EC51A7C